MCRGEPGSITAGQSPGKTRRRGRENSHLTSAIPAGQTLTSPPDFVKSHDILFLGLKVCWPGLDGAPQNWPNLDVNALDMAIKNRGPAPGGVVHADHGTRFTSWAVTNKIRSSGMMPSFGSIGDGLDNAMFDYIEIFYNFQRRHSQLRYRTPIEFELTYENQLIPA